MKDHDEAVGPPALQLEQAQRLYLKLHAHLHRELDRLVEDQDARRREAALAHEALRRAREAPEAAAGAAGAAAEIARQAEAEAKALSGAIAQNQRALEHVVRCIERVERIDRMKAEAGDEGDGTRIDLDAARREILGELSRLAARS